jgi:hypothetical protein
MAMGSSAGGPNRRLYLLRSPRSALEHDSPFPVLPPLLRSPNCPGAGRGSLVITGGIPGLLRAWNPEDPSVPCGLLSCTARQRKEIGFQTKHRRNVQGGFDDRWTPCSWCPTMSVTSVFGGLTVAAV